jgi:predicted transcriptional regulator
MFLAGCRGFGLDSRRQGEYIRAMGEHIRGQRAPVHLTRRESQIMEILHRRQRASVEEIRNELPDASSPSSVRKLLEIMIDRGLLAREPDGPRFLYSPAVTLAAASRSALKGLVRTFFNNSPGSAMAALLDMKSGPLSDEEYQRLSAWLKRSREQGDTR